ncbi:hypothetical protein DRQ53_00860 [bacterium]|nr:MAG: hypothetical protein DRQ53_00860 [bacterium]
MMQLTPIGSLTAMDPALRPFRAEGLSWCTLDEGGLIIDEQADRSWSLNPVGLFIWDHCDGCRDISQIEDDLVYVFGVDLQTARRDLQAFMLDMEDRGLLSLSYPAAS